MLSINTHRGKLFSEIGPGAGTTRRSPGDIRSLINHEVRVARHHNMVAHGKITIRRYGAISRDTHAGMGWSAIRHLCTDDVSPGVRVRGHDRHFDRGGGRLSSCDLFRGFDRVGRLQTVLIDLSQVVAVRGHLYVHAYPTFYAVAGIVPYHRVCAGVTRLNKSNNI